MPIHEAELLLAFRRAVTSRSKESASSQVERMRTDVIRRVAEGVARARAMGLVRRVWLFGSFAWGTPRDESDVDLLMEGADDPFLAAAIIESRSGHSVDAIRVERAPRDLAERVMTEGKEL